MNRYTNNNKYFTLKGNISKPLEMKNFTSKAPTKIKKNNMDNCLIN